MLLRSRIGTLAIVGVMLLLLWFVTAVTMAGVFQSVQPELALRLLSVDARAKANRAQEAITSDVRHPKVAEAQAFATSALRRDPTAVNAVTALGILSAMRGDAAGAERAFRYAQRLSRRNRVAQLWWIEREVADNDIEGALGHYDVALRTSRGMRGTLFPILMNAVSDPAIATAVNRLLRQNP